MNIFNEAFCYLGSKRFCVLPGSGKHEGNLKALLVPYPADQMRMWEISPRVNTPKMMVHWVWEPVHTKPSRTTSDPLEFLRQSLLRW